MRLQSSISRPVSLLSLAGIILFSVSLFEIILHQPIQASQNVRLASRSILHVAQVQPGPGLPIRLEIPKIHVDASIDDVGLTAQGAMDVPTGPTTAAWFSLGPRPGEIGSAVMAGHYDWTNGAPAIFYYLHTLRPGDMVTVVDDQKQSTNFMVRELRTFGRTDDAAVVFRSGDGQAHLNLITCEGVWNRTLKSYSNRLVVFTVKV